MVFDVEVIMTTLPEVSGYQSEARLPEQSIGKQKFVQAIKRSQDRILFPHIFFWKIFQVQYNVAEIKE